MNRIGPAVTALVVVLVALVGLRAIEQGSRQDVGNALQGVLATAQRGLKHWGDKGLADVDRWGAEPLVAELASSLLALPSDPQTLRTAEAQAELRALLGPVKELGVPAGAFVQIEVVDTGPGMSEDVRACVFEPFFTTRGDRGGTGLGLATCRQVAVDAGGEVFVETVLGEGSTFTLLLPRCEPEPDSRPVRPEPAPRRGSEVVLVVEDDSAARAAMVRTLEACGYRVLAAQQREEALRLDEQEGGVASLPMLDEEGSETSGW